MAGLETSGRDLPVSRHHIRVFPAPGLPVTTNSVFDRAAKRFLWMSRVSESGDRIRSMASGQVTMRGLYRHQVADRPLSCGMTRGPDHYGKPEQLLWTKVIFAALAASRLLSVCMAARGHDNTLRRGLSESSVVANGLGTRFHTGHALPRQEIPRILPSLRLARTVPSVDTAQCQAPHQACRPRPDRLRQETWLTSIQARRRNPGDPPRGGTVSPGQTGIQGSTPLPLKTSASGFSL